MLSRRLLLSGAAVGGLSLVALKAPWGVGPAVAGAASSPATVFPVAMSEEAWRKKLTPDQFAILREAGTERPYTSPLLHEKRHGVFTCAGCDQEAFSSDTKFDSGTGWPSFWAALDGKVGETEDHSFFMTRTEVHCSNCGGHLGHVFNDGPKPTGLRYCMNGMAMGFRPTEA